MKKIVVSLFTIGVVLTGCFQNSGNITSPMTGSLSENAAKEAGKKLAENMMGGTKIDFAEEGSGDVVAWPKTMSSEVPVFKYGKIDATMAAPSGVSDGSLVVSFREVEKGAYEKYRQDLKTAGWEITTDPSWTVEHISAKKGNMTIDIDADYNGANTAALYLIVDKPTAQ